MNDDIKPTTQASFAQYGKSFQEKLCQALLVDKQFAEQMLEVFNVTYLEPKYLVFLAERYFSYAQKYKVFPTMQLLITIIRDELKIGTDVVIRDQIVDYLQRMRSNPDVGDLQYVKEKALDFCRKQALRSALEEAVDQIQAEKYESIVEGIKKAVMVGTAPQLGHDFFADYESRFTKLSRNAIATGLPELDKKDILNGGLGSGELGCVVGATGTGKSHFLTFLGAMALRNNVDVLHYTFELSETQVGIRYDSNLCDIDSNAVIDSKDRILTKYAEQKLGRLIIKYFPTNTASIYTLRSHIERLGTKGFRPGLIIIDYADIMRSTRQFDSLRHELKLVYEELRGMAGELGIPVWTASQSNKEGATSEIIDMGNMSEAYGKAMIADVIVSISRRAHEKSTGQGRLYVAKNRAGRDGLVYPLHIDTSKSNFEILGGPGSLDVAMKENESDIKKVLRSKWNEMRNDPIIGENLKRGSDSSDDTGS
jgi:replicative DNA helicase